MAIYKKVVILEGGGKTATCHLTLVDKTCSLTISENIDGKDVIVKGECDPLKILDYKDGEYATELNGIARIEVAIAGDGEIIMYGATYKGVGKDAMLKEYKKLIPLTEKEIKEKVDNLEVKEQFEVKKERKQKPLDFYYSVKAQLDEMFICFPEIPSLARAVPDSKWVKVDGADGEYAVGVIYEEDTPKYICYGVPSKRDCLPPENMRKLCQYVDGGQDIGYWVVFQSADTGETLMDD